MAIKLIVTEPFGEYQKGDEIKDKKTIQAIQDGPNASHVVAVGAAEAAKEAEAAK